LEAAGIVVHGVRQWADYDQSMRVVAVHQEQKSSLDSLEAPVLERGHELVHWQAWRDPVPAELDGAGAVIVLGGLANPDQTEELPWLGRERAELARLVARATPVLAICLGAQLLASALGAPVRRLSLPEVGWWPVEATTTAASDPVLAALPARFQAFQWHDYAFDLPAGASLLAGSERAPHQAARVAPNAWALQFHLEVGPGTIAWWTVEGADELQAKGVARAQIMEDTEREGEAYVRLAREVAQRFLAVAESGGA
jgi:GMP synthase (glutamine-hydrolysing)